MSKPSNPPVLGQSFKDLKKRARQIPEVKDYLDSYSVVIGNIIFVRRMKLKLTQQELAELAGTKQSKISEIESGEANVTMEIMNRVFKALGLEDLQPQFRDEQAAGFKL
ncbi:helix-turn-helix domain-containing protein [Paenibacillus sp. YN15]|uniref:helix-turn-helix domain-containing protein n=1 Tax=Paenibacillus sp. YN15 TaxID=1742774 RepID=UPI000DCF4199|nr:helix-turn-helix domain-containing protein [Paenibacillus sp. YN15]RAU97946.1 XRE family transcriptional regulator [Paenibacillus sp. YN15]